MMSIGEKIVWANAFVSYLEKHGNDDCKVINSEIAAEYASGILQQLRETRQKLKDEESDDSFYYNINAILSMY